MSADEQIDLLRKSLGAPVSVDLEGIVRFAFRRGVFLLAPTTRPALIRFVLSPLAHLGVEKEAAEAILEEMIALGDVIEMQRLNREEWDTPPYVLRPAPPSFVCRRDESIVIIGIAGSLPSGLPEDLEAFLVYEGALRTLLPSKCGVSVAALRSQLQQLGFAELSESVWLRAPAVEQAESHVVRWQAALQQCKPLSASVEGLEILDSSKDPRFYSGRWRATFPTATGDYVAKIPRFDGTKHWCIAEILEGRVTRILALQEERDLQRPCDLAWRYQAAVDARNGMAQSVRVREAGGQHRLDFFSPLPAYNERRLSLVATKTRTKGCLFSYGIKSSYLEAELNELQQSLWLQWIEGER